MRILILFLLLALWVVGKARADFAYSAVLFGDNNPREIAGGKMDETTFKEWFLTGESVFGLRLEVPKGATPFGVLVLYSDEKRLVKALEGHNKPMEGDH